MNVVLPAEYGGPGRSFSEACLITEDPGWGCAGIGASLRLSVPPSRSGVIPSTLAPRLASFCLTEADAGSDASAITTTARRNAKAGSSPAKVLHHEPQPRQLVHGLRQDARAAGTRGISVFVVPRDAGVASMGVPT